MEVTTETLPQSLPLTGHTEATCRTILVVEDEAFVREVTCEILEREGYRVLKASNAVEAKTLFQRYKKIVGLLLTDVVLPGQDGVYLAKELRMIRPTLKAIFISGYPENAVIRSGRVEDGMFYLPKPFSAESLLRKINQVVVEKVGELASGG